MLETIKTICTAVVIIELVGIIGAAFFLYILITVPLE